MDRFTDTVMIRFYAYLLILAFGVSVGTILFIHGQGGRKTDTCTAPCVVKFPKPMAEDNFKIDYRGDGTLRVWKAQS